LILILISSVPLTFRRSYLQAAHDFSGASIANIITAMLRLLSAALLVVVGFRSAGALFGLVVAQIGALYYLYYKTRGEASLAFFTLFPQFVIQILFGVKFLTFASILPRLSLVTRLASIINLLIYYFLALRLCELLLIVLVGAVSTIAPLTADHEAPLAIVNA